MNVSNCMMLIVVAGLVLCGAYWHAQLKDWHRQRTSDAKEALQIRLLYHVREEPSR
jgi:high-affinity Fe2+/Pb2+ permease